jgi:hypothetical protein
MVLVYQLNCHIMVFWTVNTASTVLLCQLGVVFVVEAIDGMGAGAVQRGVGRWAI